MVDRSDDASRLLGLEGLAVERVVRTVLGVKLVQLVTDDPDAATCPSCGVRSTSGKDWVLTRPRDLPCGGELAVVQWRKRRWRCRTAACPRGSFTEQVGQVPAGMRTTTRLRAALALAVEDGRDQSEVALAHGVSWPTVQRAVVARGAAELVEPEPRRCWAWTRPGSGAPAGCPTASTTTDGCGGGGRIRGRPGSSTSPVIRPCWGRSTGGPVLRCRPGWPPRTEAFRAGIEVVVIDPHAGYAACGPRGAARRGDRGGPLPPGPAGEQDRDRGPPAGHPGSAGPPGPHDRPGVGEPPVAAARPGAALARRRWRGCGTAASITTRPGRSSRRGSRRRNSGRCARPPPVAGTRRDPRPALGVLPVVRRRADPRADHPGRDDRDVVAGDRGVPHHRAHQRPHRGHEPADQAGETRRLRLPEPGNYRRRVRLHCTRHTRRLSASNRRCPPKVEEPP